MTGIALEGGGTKGAYQVGVYRAMLECNIKIDGATGTSIGSFNAAMIINNDYKALEDFWLNENLSDLLGFIEDTNFEKKNVFDEIKEAIIPVLSIIKNEGIDVEPFRKHLKLFIDEEKIRNSNKDFGLATYKVKDSKPLYIFKEDMPEGTLVDYIIASCYLPVFKPIKLDDESYYLDGGFHDVSPSNMLEEKGYKKIYVIGLKAIGVQKKKLNNAEIIKIMPSRSLGGMLNTNRESIKKNIEMGYYDAIKIFKNLDGYKFVFAKKPKWVYNLLARRVSKKTLRRARAFFMTYNNKDLILKSIEYVLSRENAEYAKVYDSFSEIRRIKNIDNDLLVYKFIKELKIL